MKILQNMNYVGPDKGSERLQASDQGFLPLYSLSFGRLTRKKAVERRIHDLATDLGPLSQELNLKLYWQSHTHELLEIIDEELAPLSGPAGICILRPDFIVDEMPRYKSELLQPSHMCIDVEGIPSREYERLFWDWARLGISGVAFNNENYTRGHIALAHRFELQTLITHIVYERHEESAKNSGTDAYVIYAPH